VVACGGHAAQALASQGPSLTSSLGRQCLAAFAAGLHQDDLAIKRRGREVGGVDVGHEHIDQPANGLQLRSGMHHASLDHPGQDAHQMAFVIQL